MPNPNERTVKQSTKQEISLLTLLANEATADSRKLLKEYGQDDAKNHRDLEQKLANLYFAAPDKIEIEKKMAAIHPHKAWLLKYVAPKETKIEPAIKVEEIKKEVKSNFCPECGSSMCGDRHSSFDAQHKIKLEPPQKDHTPLIIISMVAIFAILNINLKK